MTWSEFERRIRVVHQAHEQLPELVLFMPDWFKRALAITPDEMAEARRRYIAAARARRRDLATASEEEIIVIPIWDCADCANDEIWESWLVRCAWCGPLGLSCPDFECFEE